MATMARDANMSKAIDALLTTNTLTAAAQAAGISRRTLYDYMYRDEEFARQYKRQQDLQTLQRAEQAAEEREIALKAIRDLMNDSEQPAAIRLKAALAILERADAAADRERSIAADAVEAHNPFSNLF